MLVSGNTWTFQEAKAGPAVTYFSLGKQGCELWWLKVRNGACGHQKNHPLLLYFGVIDRWQKHSENWFLVFSSNFLCDLNHETYVLFVWTSCHILSYWSFYWPSNLKLFSHCMLLHTTLHLRVTPSLFSIALALSNNLHNLPYCISLLILNERFMRVKIFFVFLATPSGAQCLLNAWTCMFPFYQFLVR